MKNKYTVQENKKTYEEMEDYLFLLKTNSGVVEMCLGSCLTHHHIPRTLFTAHCNDNNNKFNFYIAQFPFLAQSASRKRTK